MRRGGMLKGVLQSVDRAASCAMHRVSSCELRIRIRRGLRQRAHLDIVNAQNKGDGLSRQLQSTRRDQ